MNTHIFGLTLYEVFWFFLIYSFIGWLLEVVFRSITTGKFVNSGFLNGPVCPIYGVGGTVVILLLEPLAHNWLLLFAGSVVVTSALELVTGYLLQKLFHTSWWDYSDQPFNLGGYICLRFSLAWGVAAVFLMKVLHPSISGLVSLIPQMLGLVLLAIFYALLLADIIVTVDVLLKLNKDLGEITRLAEGLHKQSDHIAKSVGDKAISVAQRIEEMDLEEKLEEKKEQFSEKWEETREETKARMEAGKGRVAETRAKVESGMEETRTQVTVFVAQGQERIQKLQGSHRFFRRRLLRAFPDLKSRRYPEAMRQLQQRYSREGTKGKPMDDSKNKSAEKPDK